jgi:hypothetical protein
MRTLRLLAFLPLLATLASADEIWPGPATLPAASYPNVARHDIDLGKGVTASVRFELTPKGNGGLTIPGYGIRAYDAHRDGITFQGYLLRCEWKDMNADGYLDLVVSGIAQIWSDKDGRLESEKPISAVFHYDPAKSAFVLVKSTPEIFTWANRETATPRPSSTETTPAK